MPIVLAGVAVVILLFVLFIFAATRIYRRVPPNEAYIIYGRGETRNVVGKGTWIIPILESYKTLDLSVYTINQPGDEVVTQHGVKLLVDWVAEVKIGSDENSLNNAREAILGKSRDDIEELLRDQLSFNLRAILGQLTVEQIHSDREQFAMKVAEGVTEEMQRLGMHLVTLGIKEIRDEVGYLENMAAKRIAEVDRDARIAESLADKETRVEKAENDRLAQEAELQAQETVLERQQALQLREVEMKKQVGLAQAASDMEVQNSRAGAVAKQQEVDVLVPARARAEADEIQAEAARKKLAIEVTAETDAEERRATAQANARRTTSEAEAEATRVTGNAQADSRRAMALADADAEKAKLLATAEGTRQNLLAEAEGKEKIAAASAAEGEINLRQFVIEQLVRLEIEKAQAMAQALAGLGGNVKILEMGGSSNGNGSGTFLDLLTRIPEVALQFDAKTQALASLGENQVGNWMALVQQIVSALQNPANGHAVPDKVSES